MVPRPLPVILHKGGERLISNIQPVLKICQKLWDLFHHNNVKQERVMYMMVGQQVKKAARAKKYIKYLKVDNHLCDNYKSDSLPSCWIYKNSKWRFSTVIQRKNNRLTGAENESRISCYILLVHQLFVVFKKSWEERPAASCMLQVSKTARKATRNLEKRWSVCDSVLTHLCAWGAVKESLEKV